MTYPHQTSVCLAKWSILSNIPDVHFEKRVALAAQEDQTWAPVQITYVLMDDIMECPTYN